MNIESIMAEYKTILAEIDEEWRRLAKRDNFECGKCGACCKIPVPVSRYFEALLLREHFGQLNETKQSEILRRAHLYKQTAKRRGYARYPESPLFGAVLFLNQVASDLRGIACPLLSDENLCELYSARPVACRMYTCFDEYASWMRFHMKISKLELLLPWNWKTRFVADVLLLAEKVDFRSIPHVL